jgi:hypothetical protein
VSASHCESIAECRRRLQALDKNKVLFLDETSARVGLAPTYTVVAPGESAFVIVEETSSYAKRFDMIACCTYDRVFPPIIFTPTERAEASAKGINMRMFEQYIHSILAQAVAALDRYPLTLVMDRATIHNPEKVKQAFIEGGCQDIVDIVLMPTQAAKRMSPLDNALFNTWKTRVRNRGVISSTNIEQVMSDEWNRLSSADIQPNYQHCLLFRRQDVYADCPDPVSHGHNV